MAYNTIKAESYKVNKWSGGETKELYIYPVNSKLESRDFTFRISSATFSSEESIFSDFTGFERYILPLRGDIFLSHHRLYSRSLSPYDIEYFSGSWETSSKNTLDCIDYNLIVKSGLTSKMEILSGGDTFTSSESSIITLFSESDFTISIAEKLVEVEGNCLFLLEGEGQGLLVKSREKVIFTRVDI